MDIQGKAVLSAERSWRHTEFFTKQFNKITLDF